MSGAPGALRGDDDRPSADAIDPFEVTSAFPEPVSFAEFRRPHPPVPSPGPEAPAPDLDPSAPAPEVRSPEPTPASPPAPGGADPDARDEPVLPDFSALARESRVQETAEDPDPASPGVGSRAAPGRDPATVPRRRPEGFARRRISDEERDRPGPRRLSAVEFIMWVVLGSVLLVVLDRVFGLF